MKEGFRIGARVPAKPPRQKDTSVRVLSSPAVRRVTKAAAVSPQRGSAPSSRRRSSNGALSLWIGRLQGEAGAWFVSWGKSRAHVTRMIRDDLGEVERGTVRRLDGGGYFLCRPGRSAGLAPIEGEAIVLYDPTAESWMAMQEAARSPTATGKLPPLVRPA